MIAVGRSVRRGILGTVALTCLLLAVPCGRRSLYAAPALLRIPDPSRIATLAPTPTAILPEARLQEHVFSQTTAVPSLDSYRIHYTVRWESSAGGERTAGYWDIWGEFTRQPRARRLVWTTRATGGVRHEIIQLGMDIYMNIGSSWISITSSALDIFADNPLLHSPFDVISGYRGQLMQRGVQVYGLSTNHYSFEGRTVGVPLGLDSDARVKVDAWLLTDSSVVVKYVVTYWQKSLAEGHGDEATLRMTYDLMDINQPIVIVAPQGVKLAVPGDVPIPEGAAGLNAVAGIVAFSSARSPEEIRAFYRAQMPVCGWTEIGGAIIDEINFTKEDRTARIMLSAKDGTTYVAIACDL